VNKKIAIAALVIIILIVVGVYAVIQINKNARELTDTDLSNNPTNQSEGILLDKETNSDSRYSFEVLKYDEIENELLKKWMDNSIAGETTDGKNPVYYALYNNSSTTLDIYLFMPASKQVMGDVTLSNIRVTEAGTALIIYVDTDDKTTNTKDSTDLILHIQAVSDKAKARNERLIINGTTYSCANTTFTALK